jgi:hypothetical protein
VWRIKNKDLKAKAKLSNIIYKNVCISQVKSKDGRIDSGNLHSVVVSGNQLEEKELHNMYI